MHSHEHAVIGAAVGALSVTRLAGGRSLATKFALWTYGLFLSVFIDLDHFLIARARTGDWSHFTKAARNPEWAFREQEQVFPDLEIRVERLVSHVLIGSVLVRLLRPFSRTLAGFSAIVLAAHVLADVLRELRIA